MKPLLSRPFIKRCDAASSATPDELKALFPSLDRMKYKEKWWVIDVGGNHLRILFFASFETQKVFIKHIVSHAEYDKLMQHYRRSSS